MNSEKHGDEVRIEKKLYKRRNQWITTAEFQWKSTEIRNLNPAFHWLEWTNERREIFKELFLQFIEFERTSFLHNTIFSWCASSGKIKKITMTKLDFKRWRRIQTTQLWSQSDICSPIVREGTFSRFCTSLFLIMIRTTVELQANKQNSRVNGP